MLGVSPLRPGGLLVLDALPFLALLEGLLRERGPEAEEALDGLYAKTSTPSRPPQEDRAAAIERMMRFGG